MIEKDIQETLARLTPIEYHQTTLSNGLRVVFKRSPAMVSYIGVAVNAGSRDESDSHHGLAHFVEHTIFKATSHRRGFQISNRMECIGGELNAYTSKENTVIYTISPAGDSGRAIELLGDLVSNATFPSDELEKEKEVVIEEINGVLDSPAELVFDKFETLAYHGCGLGHDILGTPESVRALTSANCRDFIDRFYTPGEMVLFVQDNASPEIIFRLAEKHFGYLHFPSVERNRKIVAVREFNEVIDRSGHQAHTLLGAPTFDRYDERRYALYLFNNYLAGPSMNSLLNRELREKRGLVYSVDSNVSLLSDTGMLYIYMGCDRESVEKCLRVVNRELQKLADKPIGDRKFQSLKRQYIGQLLVNSDNPEAMAMNMGKSTLFYGSARDAASTAKHVAEVGEADFMEIARMVAEGASRRLTIM